MKQSPCELRCPFGQGFQTTAPYAFGFSTVTAPASGAYNVNLDPSEADGYSYGVLYVGPATWAGGAGNPLGPCTQTYAGAGAGAKPGDGGSEGGAMTGDGGGDAGSLPTSDGGPYDFSQLPPSVTFRIGFNTATN